MKHMNRTYVDKRTFYSILIFTAKDILTEAQQLDRSVS